MWGLYWTGGYKHTNLLPCRVLKGCLGTTGAPGSKAIDGWAQELWLHVSVGAVGVDALGPWDAPKAEDVTVAWEPRRRCGGCGGCSKPQVRGAERRCQVSGQRELPKNNVQI